MNKNTIYKIKDSVDLFVSDDELLTVYYMNTRQRKSFRVNSDVLRLIENIDGEKDVSYLKRHMSEKYNISSESVEEVLELMLKSRIISEKNIRQDILSKEDMHRYDRQINYFTEFLGSEEDGIRAQRKVMDSHILLFGVGAVGGNIALELVMAGVKKITIFDYDIVQASDVARHMFFSSKNKGLRKVEALKEQLLKINPEVEVEVIAESLTPSSEIENIISTSDFVINTLDEPYIGYTSSKISRICVNKNIPHYIAGGFDAHLASTGEIIIPYITPCVECYTSYFKVTLQGWKPKQHPVKSRYNEIGGLASMSLFSSSFASIEILKFIAGLIDYREGFKVRGELIFNDLELTYLNVKKNEKCPVCGGNKL